MGAFSLSCNQSKFPNCSPSLKSMYRFRFMVGSSRKNEYEMGESGISSSSLDKWVYYSLNAKNITKLSKTKKLLILLFGVKPSVYNDICLLSMILNLQLTTVIQLYLQLYLGLILWLNLQLYIYHTFSFDPTYWL